MSILFDHFEVLAEAPKGIKKLRELILQLAVQGKLVPQDPQDEPAAVLLEKIKAEKERLIKEGKLKAEKPLPPISEEEKPYELPKGWEWSGWVISLYEFWGAVHQVKIVQFIGMVTFHGQV